MTIRVGITHRTEYQFDRRIAVMPHVVRLRPAPHTRTPVHRYSLKVEPDKHFVNWQQDPFGNHLARFVFPEPMRRLVIEVDLVADLTVVNPFDFFLEEYAERFPFVYPEQLARDLTPYLEVRERGPRLIAWLDGARRTAPDGTVDMLVALNARLQRDIEYSLRMEPGVQSCEQTLQQALGSCRDSAWLLVQILRNLGLAARFVSGYLVQLAPDQASLDGPSGPDCDFTDLHAWAEVYLPGAGWVGLDPTSGLFAGEGHIPLACTPDPASAAPVEGSTDPCEVSFDFRNEVQRLHEDPRVTRPLSDAQWDAVRALGDAVDARLASAGVGLTMGGEPTFVSIDDMEGAEWTVAALGERKLELAGSLLRRLAQTYGPGAVLQFRQGKWYPGEPLPRWALSCFWRSDGEPLWRDESLLGVPGSSAHLTSADGARFAAALTAALGLDAACAMDAYEDPLQYLLEEARLPPGLDLSRAELDSGDGRVRLRRVLESGLGAPRGQVLPLAYQHDAPEQPWRSGPWRLRRDRLFLLPGDSPLGLRLPLASLEEAGEAPEPELDPMAARPPLPLAWIREPRRPRPPAAPGPGPQVIAAQRRREPSSPIHTALCVEVREGQLYVFLPPLSRAEALVALLAEVEAVAARLSLPVVLEGYGPASDPRIVELQVTPDPGVIEVNVQPAASWEALCANVQRLYELARQTRLGTEKFMLDGRHTGTGGGNHVTLGGATPADSPLLRRPDLLRSLVCYWQHHPSLSYLFSGAFIGPTSQAPRVDEARHEALYELEIAFAQLDDAASGEGAAPWLVDRALRHLLTDLTGNTHRAEFCVDKLYSPDSAAGRQGLLEFRGFEMPPHAQMSLLQMLLLRALVARFWEQPYQHRPVRWGTALHDRFMLPHFVWHDFATVIAELRQAGFGFDLAWFAAFLEFRFPHYGSVTVDGVEMSLHWAIEPWHVLGEEVTGSGTTRYVDSSVERLQLRLRGLVPERHGVACNGQRVPLTPTGVPGEYVAGVRYKAWRPPSGLHPTMAVHAPLVFDVVDLINERAVGGCTYHVVHPGGRSYETFPVNANEAEARRVARFQTHGHTPGPMRLGPALPNPEYPCTLDLRFPLHRST
jgi:uncharacterized protein (DUF2126 family)